MISPARLRQILRAAAVILSAAVVIALVQSIRRDGPAALAAWRNAHVRWAWVALSVVCGASGHGFFVFGWRRLLKDTGNPVPIWQLVRMFLVSNLGRYLPAAKAWQMGIVGMMAAEHGLPAGAIAASSLFQGLVGVGVGVIVLLAAGGSSFGLSAAWLALPLAGVAALLLLPAFVKASPRMQHLVAERLPVVSSVSSWTMWNLVWTAAASWILWGFALHALGTAVSASTTASIISYIAAWSGSFLAGLLAIVSPAGLGAREGAMQAILGNAGVTAGDALILVIIARMWMTMFDVVPAAAVLVFRKRRSRTAQ